MLHARYHAGFWWVRHPLGTRGRDDLDMSETARECAVCHELRTQDAHDPHHDVFICVSCEAAAKQFLEIQDDLYGGGAAHGSAGPED